MFDRLRFSPFSYAVRFCCKELCSKISHNQLKCKELHWKILQYPVYFCTCTQMISNNMFDQNADFIFWVMFSKKLFYFLQMTIHLQILLFIKFKFSYFAEKMNNKGLSYHNCKVDFNCSELIKNLLNLQC